MGPLDATALVVDDDAAVGTVLSALLGQAGVRTVEAKSAEDALAALERRAVDVIVSDVRMPGIGGMELLRRVNQSWPDIPVIMLTAHGSVPLAVEAMKAGASDFVLKPFEREEILFCVEKALLASRSRRSSPPPQPHVGSSLLGDSPAMRDLGERIRRAAATTATVLVRGETGTGKELVARALHEQSSRRDKPFVKLSCAALPESLLESELFGHEKGAFTGAVATKPGRVELADGGSLFLDEIGDVPLPIQVKLLRILQEREIERLGGNQTLRVDVRFIAATHRPLEDMVARGAFREDLFYRLDVVRLELPPLRERAADIEPLARHFAGVFAAANGRRNVALTPDAVARLAAEPWPGNVRQLENFMERLIVMSDDDAIDARAVERELAPGTSGAFGASATSVAPAAGGAAAAPSTAATPVTSSAAATSATPGGAGRGLEEQRREAEGAAIADALRRAQGNRSLAARLLGISRRTLYNKLGEYGLG